MTGVVNIRGDRLYHEHISWDHASALRQIGVIPEKLPLTVQFSGTNGAVDGHLPSKQYEITLPVAGTEGVEKMRDKNSVESNLMFEYKAVEL
jgi:carboxymethylenebutenolidase